MSSSDSDSTSFFLPRAKQPRKSSQSILYTKKQSTKQSTNRKFSTFITSDSSEDEDNINFSAFSIFRTSNNKRQSIPKTFNNQKEKAQMKYWGESDSDDDQPSIQVSNPYGDSD